MFNLGILDVVIGLIFIYFIISVVCSAIVEAANQLSHMRGKYLKEGLNKLLSDPHGEVTKKLLKHPLIAPLVQNDKAPPSYLPSDLFAKALLSHLGLFDSQIKGIVDRLAPPDPLLPQSLIFWLRRAADGQPIDPAVLHELATALADVDLSVALRKQVTAMEASEAGLSVRLAKQLLAVLAPPPPTRDEQAAAIEELIKLTKALPIGGNARDAITFFLTDERGNLRAVERRLAAWYDQTMDRVSGWFTRYTRVVLAIVAGLIIISANIDTIRIVETLYREPALRESLVEGAKRAANEAPSPPAVVVLPPTTPVTGPSIVMPPSVGPTGQAAPAIDPVNNRLLAAKENLAGAAPFLGWPDSGLSISVNQVAGWFLSFFAIMLGGPFWFDLLQKVARVRASLTPAEAEQKRSEEPTSPRITAG